MASKLNSKYSKETLVTFAVLQSVKNDLESASQAYANSLGEKLQKTQLQWKDLVFKVQNLEKELKSTKDEVGNLRSSLIEEREKWKEEEENNNKLRGVIIELQRECVKLEEKIVEFEEKSPAGPSSADNDMFSLFDEFITDTTSNFELCNRKQAKIEEEMEGMKQVLKTLTVPAVTPPPSAPEVTPKPDNCKFSMMPEEELTSLPVRTPSPPVLSPAHSPFPAPTEEEEVVSFGSRSPLPNPAVGSAPVYSLDSGCGWEDEHGVDPTNPSRKSCLCGSSFDSKASLKNHIFHSTNEWKFPCQFCKIRFPDYSFLRKHLEVAHDVMAIPGEDKKVGCRLCGAVLKTRLQHKNHLRLVHGHDQHSSTRERIRTNTKKKPKKNSESIAEGVTKSFSPSMQRRQVRRRPGPDTVHGIDHAQHLHFLCGRKYDKSTGLSRHITHYTRRVFVCVFCDKRFAYKCYLKAHSMKFHKFTAQVKQERVEVWTHE